MIARDQWSNYAVNATHSAFTSRAHAPRRRAGGLPLSLEALDRMRQRTLQAVVVGAAFMLVVPQSSRAAEGKTWGFTVTHEDLLRESDWAGPDSGSPAPLRLERAVEISRGELRRYYPDLTNWAVEKASLDSAC